MTSLARLCSSRAASVSSISLLLSSTRTIRFSLFIGITREREIKRGTSIRLSLRPYSSAMACDDSLHVGQTDAGSFEFIRVVEPLEYAKKFLGVFHEIGRASCRERV